MASNLKNEMPALWRVGAVVICRSQNEPVYEGYKEIPQTKVAMGHIYVHGFTLEEARARARRVIEKTYDENFLRVDFVNTKVVSKKEAQDLPGGFKGLDYRL